ncbi:MAG: hypothetical protein ACRCVX_04020, partial [Shewanella sp.]
MKSAYKIFLAGLCSLFLVACGGGGSIGENDSGNPPTPSVVTVSLSITNAQISAATPAIVSAKVVDSKLGALANHLVTFSLDDSALGVFQTLDNGPSNGAVLTDTNGVASIKLLSAQKAGGGTVSAKVSSGASGTVAFMSKGDGGDAGGGAQVNLVLTDASGTPIKTITALNPGKLTATVTGISKPSIVTFANDIGDLPIKTAVTDSQGKASVDIYAGNTLGAGTITASLVSGEQADTVVVVGATNVVMGSGTPFVAGKA